MPRPLSLDVRSLLIDRAAGMLAKREPVTLRSLVAGTGVSTMAVYTYFEGMPGLWGAVRQEGFRRLENAILQIPVHRDPVRELASLGVAYVENAVMNPDLFRVMFDAAFDLPERRTADQTFDRLVAATRRAIELGRFEHPAEAADVALEFWASGHGIVSLGITGVLPVAAFPRLAPALATAVFVHAGDSPERAQRSVTAAWRSWSISHEH